MYEELHDKGLEILAYPCNQFGSQEPHSNEWILNFITSYNVKFPVMQKIEVMNARQEPLFGWLRKGALDGGDMEWNFEKFLIDRNGEIVGHWRSEIEPNAIRFSIE